MPKAIISVSDKSHLEELLQALKKFGYEFISTGGTANFIRSAGFQVQEISDLTGFPEMLDGRVKTLHPKALAGVLARRDVSEHLDDLRKHDIDLIDLVIVNLYPFKETISAPNVSEELAIENIDIGGPTLLRSAAKNCAFVNVLCEPSQYADFVEELNQFQGKTSEGFRKKLAFEVFSHTANYDALISKYLGSQEPSLIRNIRIPLEYKSELRYGENPHQKAALYADPFESIYNPGIANAKQLHGKEISFNNLLDLDSAWRIVCEYDSSIPCVSIIKHNNPCGVAIAPSVAQAFSDALSCDTISAFGGIVASNAPIDLAAANEMTQLFLEAIVAPHFTEDALDILRTKKNLRLLECSPAKSPSNSYDIKKISGGYLLQEPDSFLLDPSQIKVVTQKQIEESQWVDLLFAWKVVKHVKSNGIVTALGGKTLGIGVGQTNRVKSVEDAVRNFDIDTRSAVLASDAFFPFPDNIDIAAQNHISAIIQPGGSVKDQEVIAACDKYGIAMVFTSCRHFRH